jgi:RNA polymerase sigma factor (sigma-70 family)
MPAPDPADPDRDVSDEDLVGRLASGRQEACAVLYRRYASLIFGTAARTLGVSAAEEIVQEVLATVWRKAGTYDPSRGAVRPWILRIAHTRILNELRRRRRHPASPEPEENGLDALPGADSGPDEAAWSEYRRLAVRSAVDALPAPQRQALRLAFFDELTHEQASAFLEVPLGTVKTRIRAALAKLRPRLAPYATALLLVVVGVFVATRWNDALDAAGLRERALRLVTSSDIVPLRLTVVDGTASDTHATYRGRPGTGVAVMTFSHFPQPPAGRVYRAWAQRDGRWTPIGSVDIGADGAGLVIVEGPQVVVPPDVLEVTIETPGGDAAPTGSPIVRWSRTSGH